MKAIRITQNGDASVLQVQSLPQPKPGNGEALVRLKAAGLNFIDIYMRTGRYPRELPYTPGLEASGIVEEIGSGVTEVKVGDRVAYAGNVGSYAEYNVVKASHLIPLPKEFSFEQGAAFPLQGMTAHYLVHEYYKIKPQDHVLAHAAAGGVGLLLVQWLKHMGATVVGTVSTEEKAKIAREAGADPRSYLLVLLLLETGLKKEELFELKLTHFDFSNKYAPELWLKHTGKKVKKDRKLKLPHEIVSVFHDYVKQYGITEVIFPYTPRFIEMMLIDTAKRAELQKKVTAGILRDTFVVRCLKRGEAIENVLIKIGLSAATGEDAKEKYLKLAGRAI